MSTTTRTGFEPKPAGLGKLKGVILSNCTLTRLCNHAYATANAYQQLVLDEKSRKLTTINTTKGLFKYVRLPCGVSFAPGIYERIMEQLLQNILMTVVSLDDILVSGSTPEQRTSSSMCIFRNVSRPRLAYINGVWNRCYRTFCCVLGV